MPYRVLPSLAAGGRATGSKLALSVLAAGVALSAVPAGLALSVGLAGLALSLVPEDDGEGASSEAAGSGAEVSVPVLSSSGPSSIGAVATDGGSAGFGLDGVEGLGSRAACWLGFAVFPGGSGRVSGGLSPRRLSRRLY